MRFLLLFQVFYILIYSSNAQVIPDLTVGDHYRPYYSESQKKELLLNQPKSTKEGKTELSGNSEEYLKPIIPPLPNPNNSFPNYTQNGIVNFNVQKPIDPSAYFQQRTRQNYESSLAAYEADKAAYDAQKQLEKEQLEEANKELYKPTIRYNLGMHNDSDAERYANAFSQLNAMLSGEQKIDFLKAVWLVESSFDTSLSWQEFSGMFQSDLEIISALMAKDKLPANDNLAKLMSIYKFMADTTTVYLKSKERSVTSKPMLYDFEDYEAKKDITKVFVSKLLRTGTGQCMSLPMLYYLYSNALGAKAHIAFAPEHTYITFQDHVGNWQNIELTGRMFTTNDFYWLSGFIKTEQRKSGIYLTPISEKETIAYLLTTLTLTYVRTFGTDDRVLEMALTAKKYSPRSLTANMILAGYTQELWKDILRQYDVYKLTETDLANDQTAQLAKKQKEIAKDHLFKDLGYSKMPEWAYKKWLEGVNASANRKQHLVKRRQLEHQLNK
jgi:hypothetical protein